MVMRCRNRVHPSFVRHLDLKRRNSHQPGRDRAGLERMKSSSESTDQRNGQGAKNCREHAMAGLAIA